MTYQQYIDDTTDNCRKVLSDCRAGELLDYEYVRQILWEDERVTGVISGRCSSVSVSPEDNIKDVIFDPMFLKDFNERGMNMQEVMAHGADAIDVVARCLALKHISMLDLIEEEQQRRIKRQREARNNSVIV